MKKLTPLFLSAAALVALSPEVANAQGNPVDPDGHIKNSGSTDDRTQNRPQVPQEPATPSSDVVQEVKPVTTDDQIVEVEERREQDVTAAVLDESSIEVDQVYHTPVQDDDKYRYEYTPDGDLITDRDKNEVQVNFTVNDQSRLVNQQGQAGDTNREFLGSGDAGKSNFRLVNRNDFGPKTIKLSDFNDEDLFTEEGYVVSENELEDGTFEYSFDLAFNIPNNSISTVYDLVGTFIDENNNTIDRVISAINVVHQDALVEIRDERTHPDVEAYQPAEKVNVPFKRVIKYVEHDEDVYVANKDFEGYKRGEVIHPDDVDKFTAGESATVYNLNLGERITIQNGVNGSKTIFYKQEFVDGKAATEVIEDNFRTADIELAKNDRDAIDQIVLVGSVITNVDRVSGDDRFKNAVQLSRHGWNAENAEELVSEWGAYGSHVFIANADKYADSLTGTPLAAANGAPILLTRGNTLNGAVADELARLYDLFQGLETEDTFGVTVLGGINSISEDVATAISTALLNDDGDNADTYEIDRIGGIDRYHQAYLVAEELVRINPNAEGSEDDNAIYIASGDTFSDALAIAAQAGEYRNPVLLTRGNTLNEYARKFLETHISDDSVADVHEANVAIVGGPSTISQTVATQINEILADKVAEGAKNDGVKRLAGGWVNREYYTNPLDYTPVAATVDRISGANRYAVSRNVNEDATYTDNESSAEAAYTHYLVVSGDHPSDALPASALANQIGAGVLLVSNNTQRAREQLIAAIENGVTDFTFIGGVNTLSDATFNIFNYTGDTIRAIIEGPENFSNVINDGQLSDLLDDSAL